MSYSSKTKLAVAVSLVLSSAAATAFDIDSVTELKYARELGTATLTGDADADCNLEVTGKTGMSIPYQTGTAPVTRYFRFDLSGGAKFDAEPALSVNGEVSVFEGGLVSGGTGESFVIFSVSTGSGSGTAIEAEDTFIMDTVSIEPANGESPIRLTYTLHTNAPSAASGVSGSPIHKTGPVNYIQRARSYNFSVVPKNATANVESRFIDFTPGAVPSASLGVISLASPSGVCDDSGSFISINSVIDSSAGTLEIVGDFSLLQDVDADGQGLGTYTNSANATSGKVALFDGSCSGTLDPDYQATINATGTVATLALGTVTADDLDDKEVCLIRPSNSQVMITPHDEYYLTLKPEPAGSFELPSQINALLGSVLRDGVVLESPYFTVTANYQSRFMLAHLNPNGTDAEFTVSLQTDVGSVPIPRTDGPYPYDAATETFSGTLKAGTMLHINASDLVTGFTGKPRGSAVFTFVGSNSDLQGIYQTVNMNTGEVGNIPMPRPGGGTGKR